MGTSKNGRYLNTYGTGRSVSDFALVHSSEGSFTRSQTRANGKMVIKLRLDNGGHSQKGMDLLDKYGIKYNIEKTYSMVSVSGMFLTTKNLKSENPCHRHGFREVGVKMIFDEQENMLQV